MLDANERIRRNVGRAAMGLLTAAALAVGGIGFLSQGAASSAPACTGSTDTRGSGSGGAATVRATAAAPPASAPAADAAPGNLLDGLLRTMTGALTPVAAPALGAGQQLQGSLAPLLVVIDSQLSAAAAKLAAPP